MKLFAENEHEKQLLDGLIHLLLEIGVSAEAYTEKAVVAPVFWTIEDLDVFSYLTNSLSSSEQEDFLCSIEEPLYHAMVTAGYELILKELTQNNNVCLTR